MKNLQMHFVQWQETLLEKLFASGDLKAVTNEKALYI